LSLTVYGESWSGSDALHWAGGECGYIGAKWNDFDRWLAGSRRIDLLRMLAERELDRASANQPNLITFCHRCFPEVAR